MNFITQFASFFLHIDAQLNTVMQQYGTLTYAILFALIFIETGVVVMPFLPGDSLLFAVGALAARGSLHLGFVLLLLCAAAIIGDTVNYWVGKKIGPRVFTADSRFLKKSYMDKTRAFYDKYGAKTIIFARFVPIVRTFAPFVAGVGQMPYKKFLTYNVVGGVTWVCLFTLLGYFFGNIPVVEKNFTLVIIAIIAISFVPPAFEYAKKWLTDRRSKTVTPTKTESKE